MLVPFLHRTGCRLIPALIAYSDRVVGSPGFEMAGSLSGEFYPHEPVPMQRPSG